MKPTEPDRKLVRAIKNQFPPDGLIRSLRMGPQARLDSTAFFSFGNAVLGWAKDPLYRFDDPAAQQAFDTLHDRIGQYVIANYHHGDFFKVRGLTLVGVGPEQQTRDADGGITATQKINQAKDQMIEAYDEFFRIAYKRHLT